MHRARNAMNEESDRYGRHFNEDIAHIRALPPADRRAIDNRRHVAPPVTNAPREGARQRQ
jgi:hypothetical protein